MRFCVQIFNCEYSKTATKTNKQTTIRKNIGFKQKKPTRLKFLSHFQLFVPLSIFSLDALFHHISLATL